LRHWRLDTHTVHVLLGCFLFMHYLKSWTDLLAMLRHVVNIDAAYDAVLMRGRITAAGRTKVGATSTVLVIDDDPFLTEFIHVAQATLALGDTVVAAEIRQCMATAMDLSVEAGRPWAARGIAPSHASGAMRHKEVVWPS
jgi:hypothetical protein